jgi:hypothetical protein
MRRSATLAAMAALALVASCGNPQEGRRVQILADQYYRNIQSGNLEQAAQLYLPQERGLALAMLQETRDKLGALHSYHFTGAEQNTVFSGRFYIFTVGTEYDHGEHTERLTLRSQVNTDEIVVVSQKIDPVD